MALFWIIQLPAPYVSLLILRVDMSSDTHVASYRDDCDIRNIGGQYAIVGGRHRWVHRWPYRMVPHGGMAVGNELWWRMVPAQTTTSVVSCRNMMPHSTALKTLLQKRSTRGSITLYLLQLYQYMLLE